MIMVIWPCRGMVEAVFLCLVFKFSLAPLVWLKILNMIVGINNLMMEALDVYTFTQLSSVLGNSKCAEGFQNEY